MPYGDIIIGSKVCKMEKEYKILYEDNEIIVIHKPAGLAVETGAVAQKDLISELKKYRSLNNEPATIYLVHRLDQPVEGLMVVAKNSKSAARLSESLQKDGWGKDYLALVPNVPDMAETETLTDYLVKDAKTNSSKVTTSLCKEAKKAVLSYKVRKKNAVAALLEVKLKTGRHHQIRVQLAHRGMPILGDTKYADAVSRDLTKQLQIKDICLCAYRLSFVHPVEGREMLYSIKAPFEDKVEDRDNK